MRGLTIILAAAGLCAAAPALAQIEQLPSPSRSESNVNSLNRQITTDQQNRAITQQNQFELNSLRLQQSRPAISLPAPIPSPLPR